mmetsp:Transcript_40826/g.89302  ORF Transcript_40826/g.89302 Transcript_40826/m.89302 type:complete len:88 (+) Transcript_40826:150-413(+)
MIWAIIGLIFLLFAVLFVLWPGFRTNAVVFILWVWASQRVLRRKLFGSNEQCTSPRNRAPSTRSLGQRTTSSLSQPGLRKSFDGKVN